jgi:hypothetical protein
VQYAELLKVDTAGESRGGRSASERAQAATDLAELRARVAGFEDDAAVRLELVVALRRVSLVQLKRQMSAAAVKAAAAAAAKPKSSWFGGSATEAVGVDGCARGRDSGFLWV